MAVTVGWERLLADLEAGLSLSAAELAAALGVVPWSGGGPGSAFRNTRRGGGSTG